MKKKKKNPWIYVGILGLLVLLCLFNEAQKRERQKNEKKQQTPASKQEQVQKEKQGENLGKKANVKVLLNTTNFTSPYHEKISITGAKGFMVTVDGKTKKYKSGAKVTFTQKGTYRNKKIFVKGEKGGKLKVLSLRRQNRAPSYRGNLIIKETKKGFCLINEIYLEKYLWAVIPSELSTKSNMEALKAQAVCARTYAYHQIKQGRYKKYGADLDDSVSCQVYNNVPEDKRSCQAVRDTKNRVLKKRGKLVLTYYYSTSWGVSAEGSQVWNTPKPISYLKEKLQITPDSQKKTGYQELNLSTESAFSQFINTTVCRTYDMDSPWYRWNVSLKEERLWLVADDRLQGCYEANPRTVLTQTKQGNYKQKPLKPLGKIRKIRVEKRQESGLVTEIVIVGSKNVVKVCTQYAIRKVLAPVKEKIHYNHGKNKTSYSLLPSSAFYVLDMVKGEKLYFKIVGGGFGHGAGMSQEGAAQMAKMGNNYKQILAHYFQGTKVCSVKG